MTPDPHQPASGPQSLPRVLGPWLAAAVVVGTVIGTGVFKKGRNVAENVPEFGLAISVWVLVGVLALLGCMPDVPPPEADPPEVEVSGGELPEYEYDAADLEEQDEGRLTRRDGEQAEPSPERPLTPPRR